MSDDKPRVVFFETELGLMQEMRLTSMLPGHTVVALSGVAQMPEKTDAVLQGLDLAGEPYPVDLRSSPRIVVALIAGTILLPGGEVERWGHMLVPTLESNGVFCVGVSSDPVDNDKILQQGASMAMLKPSLGALLYGSLTADNCQWPTGFESPEVQDQLLGYLYGLLGIKRKPKDAQEKKRDG